ncbi:hypothetical protein BB558_001797 [Smittium angustum]|uniref:CCHC-type domain-containing protein n=1 Tax=Smittium angustum TaxID=133377 RepID=A0A2U1JAC9_SMIAN|nr:hypothetical protein BB558_001797 [Smittium angustum]
MEVKEIMREVQEVAEEWEEGLKSIRDTKTQTVTEAQTLNSSRKTLPTDPEVEELTQLIKSLTLILQKKVVRKDPNELECFTCGKRGHISKFCRARLNDSTADGIKAKEDNIQSPKSGMLAVLPPKEEEEEEAKMLASQVIGNKRIRIEDLIEQQESRPIKELSPRLGLEKEKRSKKKQQLRIRYSPLAEKVLDSNANLTIREVLRTMPRLYKQIGQTMRKEPGLRKNSLYAEIENENKSKTVDMEPVYIIFEINERNIPALVDTGATYSLISRELAKELNITEYTLTKPVSVQSVQGDIITIKKGGSLTINERNIPALVDTGATYSLISRELAKELNITEYTLTKPVSVQSVQGDIITIKKGGSLTVRIEEEIEVCLPVLILAECAVPLLLGMGACKTLGMRIDLKKDEVSLSANNKKIKVPIYQKEALSAIRQPLKKKILKVNSDQEDSESEISEVEELEVSSDDDYTPMFYATQKADISETVQLHFEQSGNAKKLDETPEEIRDIIITNANLFSTEIKIIKDSDFLIKVPDDARPFPFKLRRSSE